MIVTAKSKTAIILVGPPGSGKTSAGRILAQRLCWSFNDTDELIESKAGMKVSTLFAKQGEEQFRKMETGVLETLARERPFDAVIATGGGIIVTKGNYELMSQIGSVVCLMGAVDTLVARLSGDSSRPLLVTNSTEEDQQTVLTGKLTNLLLTRACSYAQVPCTVDTDGLSPEEVADVVMKQLDLC